MPKEPMAGLQYQPTALPVRINSHRPDNGFVDNVDRFAQQPQHVPPPMYPQPPQYVGPVALVNNVAPPMANFYNPINGPTLPPIRNYEVGRPPVVDQRLPNQSQSQSQSQRPYYQRERAAEKKDERPVGGVSAKLDYDMDTMTDFVADTATEMYALLTSRSICLADIDIAGSIIPRQPIPQGFRKWVHQVLSATRLPSSTIVLAFDYLSVHMRILQSSNKPLDATDSSIYSMLTTSLILGSKFLDDNTFINRSWAEVSGIDVAVLNRMERMWLAEISFHLHRDPDAGFNTFLARWRSFELTAPNMRGQRKPKPINTGMSGLPPHRMLNMYSPTGPAAFSQTSPPPPAYNPGQPQSSYPTPSYRCDPFPAGRASTNTSPASAPHTGPTTPEYYGPQSVWAPLPGNFGFSRLPPSNFSQVVQASQATHGAQGPQLMAHPQNGPAMNMPYPAPMFASGHGAECFCHMCNRQFMMVPHFGLPQPVAS
jgi:hypothetical protein